MIEIADDADTARAGSPHRKINACDAGNRLYVRAEFFVGVVVAAFTHQVQIEFA